MVETKLERISEWFESFGNKTTEEGRVRFCILKIKKDWVTPPSIKDEIEYVVSSEDSQFKTISVIGLAELATIEDILDECIRLVEYNVEIKLKETLFNEMIDNVKNLFAKCSYDELKTLKIVFDKKTTSETPLKNEQVKIEPKSSTIKINKKQNKML